MGSLTEGQMDRGLTESNDTNPTVRDGGRNSGINDGQLGRGYKSSEDPANVSRAGRAVPTVDNGRGLTDSSGDEGGDQATGNPSAGEITTISDPYGLSLDDDS